MAQDFFGMLGGMFGGTGGAYDSLLSDEQKRRINQQTLMNMGAKLLMAGGPSTQRTSLGQALGGALMTGQEARQAAEQNAVSQMLTGQKIEEYKREKLKDQQWQNAMQGIMGGATPAPAAGQQSPMGPGSVPFPASPTAAVPASSAAASPFSMITPVQAALLGGMDRKTGQAEMFKLVSQQDPEIIRTMRSLGMAATPENYIKMKQAGATNITNIQNAADKALAGAVGGDVQKEMRSATDMARAANSTLSNIDMIRQNTSGAILGPGADARTWLMRASGALGVSGKDDAETLSKTRAVVQGMAREELNAAASMKGQGPITENERAIIKRAALGDQSLTADELNVAMNAVEKIAREKIALHGNLLNSFSTMPGMQQFVPFYTVGGKAMDPIEAELARRQQGGK